MRTVLFLCPHGGAKSVIAAAYFNRLAQERGLPARGEAAAAEEPYQSVPPPVADMLAGEGLDVHAFRPRRVLADDLRTASRVVSIDCDLSHVENTNAVERWDDVPMASVDLAGSVAAIRTHVERLVSELHDRS